MPALSHPTDDHGDQGGAADPVADAAALLHPRARPARRIGLGAAIVLVVLAVGVSAWWSATSSGGGAHGTVTVGVASDEPVALAAEPPLLVHVLGAVARPGLVELAAGSRAVDAIAAAGGLAADADPAGVNLARPVTDGEQLRVPKVGEVVEASGAGGGAAAGGGAGDGLVHLNTADVAALDTLPRIGLALAQRIIDYREANGPFASVDQLGDVAGIGDAILSGLDGLVAL
ncbi:ComEA family DNA-binding protein [Agromyces seonyuensis]|uniref:Soluble ligand binding domain-containing protein n=1 Tax=Agromyces seonyuensis TaxID=2662446 RepID=A0A6I4P161_9MICO|nr:ComEA family DNA-binding protein [Agromyces seonyuensis]MWC00102.1 hypothetical protein [Agromyces seonyuensis]